MILSLIFGIVLGAVSVLFALQNVSVVTITFLRWHFEGSLALVLLSAIGVGVVITLLVLLPTFIKDLFYQSAIEKQKKDLEKDLAQTRRVLEDVSSRPYGSPPAGIETARTI
jgi:uncharacterized integral membrane protein